LNIKKLFKSLKYKSVSYLNKQDITSDLIIFDDVFPNPLSDWRYNEFINYLDKYENSFVITNISKTKFKRIDNHTEHFIENNIKYSKRIINFNPYHTYNAKLGYCLFYNNLKIAYPFFEKYNIPFVFTLYPGGGFSIYDKRFEQSLERYFASSLFKHVIVNMPHVYNYLINNFNLDNNKITLIYGVPINLPMIENNTRRDDKVKVLFSSHKYTQHGIDKGFDVFNKVAKLFENDNRLTFDVIGGFTKEDMVIDTSNISFINELLDNQLSEKMRCYDIILSLNRSHVLHYGAFDGFPTGSVLHAINSGCLMMSTDDWDNSNSLGLVDGVDFIRVSTSAFEIKERIEKLIQEPSLIKNIAANGKQKLQKLILANTQLIRRESIISSYL
jgi:hypothetical protein